MHGRMLITAVAAYRYIHVSTTRGHRRHHTISHAPNVPYKQDVIKKLMCSKAVL